MKITINMLKEKMVFQEDLDSFREAFGESINYDENFHKLVLIKHPDIEALLIEKRFIKPLLFVYCKDAYSAGYRGYSIACNKLSAIAGDGGIAISGNKGNSIVGSEGYAESGYSGEATAGPWGTAKVGIHGRARAGENGVIIIAYWPDQETKIDVYKVGIIGQNALKANVFYKLDENNQFVEA